LRVKSEQGTLPVNPIIVKTIVSTLLVKRICADYGCEMVDVLTGFKYIGEVILGLEQKNEENRFLLGFEESYGYLAGTYVRDKDAVVASMLIAEMAAYYKKQGKTLTEVIDGLYDKYGYYLNRTLDFYFEGASGMDKMAEIMNSLRVNTPAEINGKKVVAVADYLESKSTNLETNEAEVINLPKSNVLSYSLEGGNAVIVRPSGTEPKIKLYLTSVGNSKENTLEIMESLAVSAKKLLGVE